MTKTGTAVLALAVAATLMASCGKKGPPVPPGEEIPGAEIPGEETRKEQQTN